VRGAEVVEGRGVKKREGAVTEGPAGMNGG